MPKYQVIYREHNKLHLDTLHIGPFDSFDTAQEMLETLPALGSSDSTEPDGYHYPGCKYVEPIFKTFAEALQSRIPMTDEEWEEILPGRQI